MSEPSEKAKALLEALEDGAYQHSGERAIPARNTMLSYIAALEAVADAAEAAETQCDYDVKSGPQEDPHSEDCGACSLKAALEELERA